MVLSHRVPFEELSGRSPTAILVFAPAGSEAEEGYSEYFQYFDSKSRAGVIDLTRDPANPSNFSLYVAPRRILESSDDFSPYVEAGVDALGDMAHAALTLLQE